METKKPRRQKKRISNVENWIKKETDHKRNALENASRHFGKDDALTVNTLEGVYGQESSFGSNRGKRGIAGASGDFQLERRIAKKMGLKVSPKNDQRFDVDNTSAAAAKYLKTR
jgi:Transglycosylase SLT domain